MLKNELIYTQVISAITSTPSDAHPVCEILDQLGLHGDLIAHQLGVTPSAYSQWKNGHSHIPKQRFPALIKLLRAAVITATKGLGDMADKPMSPSQELGFHLYRIRVLHAKEILQTLEAER